MPFKNRRAKLTIPEKIRLLQHLLLTEQQQRAPSSLAKSLVSYGEVCCRIDDWSCA